MNSKIYLIFIKRGFGKEELDVERLADAEFLGGADYELFDDAMVATEFLEIYKKQYGDENVRLMTWN